MTAAYTHIFDLAKEAEPPEDDTLSRTVFDDGQVKAIIFGFGQGQELSEHTASKPAILHFLRGAATLTIGDDPVDAQPGTWIHMPAGMKNSIKAQTTVAMLLLLFK